MHYVDTDTETLVWPHASVGGHSGRELLDTGWDLHWPGPGRVYLDDRDIVDIIVPALGRDPIIEALVVNGWTEPDVTSARVAELEQQLEEATAALDAARTEADGLLAALLRATPDEVDPHDENDDSDLDDGAEPVPPAPGSPLTVAAAAAAEDV